MLLQRISSIEAYLRDFIRDCYAVSLPPLVVETPPNVEMGDLAFPFPFELAKHLRRAPRQIAQEVVEKLGVPPEVDRFEAAGAGYVNAFLRRDLFLQALHTWLETGPTEQAGTKIIVEHTNINPNKAAHIGHLRNAALGDTFVRLLRARGKRLEVQNYIDNTGVQVADVVVGFEHLRRLGLEEVRELPDPFDYFCWDLYAEVSEWYGSDPERILLRQRTLEAIEAGSGQTAALAEYISMRIVRAHLETMSRLGVRYDVLPRESEILHLKFWEQAFRQLRETGAIHFAEAGPHQGCWVMHLPEDDGQPEDEKIIVRSNGTVTYVGKDIAYQLWKFGLLGKTFFYEPFYQYPDGHIVWVTRSEPSDSHAQGFGNGLQVFNVIDVRQSYLQRVVVQGLRRLGYQGEADRSIHFSYEMVALTPRCCVEMGIELPETELSKPYVEVSGRKGLGVKADDLIDTLIERSRAEVDARQQDLPEGERERIAAQIAVGALRYFLLKYSRNSVIAFDFAEALSFEGETGPYLQYTVVRANNIFRKRQDRGDGWSYPEWKERVLRSLDESVARYGPDSETWALIQLVARIDSAMDQSERNLEVSHLAKHCFTIAQQFNLFYHRCHILSEEDSGKQDFYLFVVEVVRSGLNRALDILGIEVPERM